MTAQLSLYRLYDRTKVLLYVGRTVGPPTRVAGRDSMSWWKDVDIITVEHYSDMERLLEAEWFAIENECPKFNVSRPTRKQVVSVVKGDSRLPHRETVALPFPSDVFGSSLASDDGTLLTRDQVAAYLQVSVRTVDGWKADGTLPYVNLASAGRRAIRFAQSDVDRLVHREQVARDGASAEYDEAEQVTRKPGLLSRLRKTG